MTTAPSTKGAATVEPEALARYFRVLGDPTRLRILTALLEKEQSVSELVRSLRVPQSRISNHLGCLRWCRFVIADRRGRRIVYRIADDRVAELLGRGAALTAPHCDHLASCSRIGPEWA